MLTTNGLSGAPACHAARNTPDAQHDAACPVRAGEEQPEVVVRLGQRQRHEEPGQRDREDRDPRKGRVTSLRFVWIAVPTHIQ